MTINIRKACSFVGLTLFFNFLLVALYFLFGGRAEPPGYLILCVAYMFVPMLCAIVVQKLIYKAPLREPLRIKFRPNRWFAVAWLFPPVFACATFGVALLFPGVSFSPEMAGMLERFKDVLPPEQLEEMQQTAATLPIHPFWIALLQGLVAGVTINAVAAFGEELGWRGLLQRELGPLGFWKSSVVIGIVWGLWHAPLILQGHNYPQHPWIGVLMMTAFTTLLSPLMAFITQKANSVIAAAVFHGTLNGTGGLAILLIVGGNDLTVGITGLAGLIVLAAANVVLFCVMACQPTPPDG